MAVGRRSEAATPYTREIHVKTTRFEMEATPRAHGEPCLAVRRRHVNDEGGGGTAQCAICMEELSSSAAAGADASDDDVTNLPCCSHAFHRGCILRWFDKAPTCPFCRRDMMQYLTATYRLYHMLQHYIPNKKF
uniref:RING-type domain-containing protein n=1 Tax=Oryza brachyantha TaxID=4533 RepID=J3L7I1_ORYBR